MPVNACTLGEWLEWLKLQEMAGDCCNGGKLLEAKITECRCVASFFTSFQFSYMKNFNLQWIKKVIQKGKYIQDLKIKQGQGNQCQTPGVKFEE